MLSHLETRILINNNKFNITVTEKASALKIMSEIKSKRIALRKDGGAGLIPVTTALEYFISILSEVMK